MMKWILCLAVFGLTACTATKKDLTDDGGSNMAQTTMMSPPPISQDAHLGDDVDGDPPERPSSLGKSMKRGIATTSSTPRILKRSPQVLAGTIGVPIQDVHQWTYGRAWDSFVPMMWNGNYNSETSKPCCGTHRTSSISWSSTSQISMTRLMSPRQAAELWPKYEAIAQNTGVQIVGPAMNWGTIPEYGDPIIWLDEFFEEYAALNDGAEPQVDYLAFHWYDYGLESQLDRLAEAYGKPFWVTEFANWHGLWQGPDGAEIDTVEKQIQQMTEMVEVCERRDDVFRYSWFTGRWENDSRHTSLLRGPGELTALGRHYISLPYSESTP